MKLKEKAEKIFNDINDLIPIEASFHDTVEEAEEKITRDHLATKEICNYIITDEYNSKTELIKKLRKNGYIGILDRLTLLNELEQEFEELKQEIEKL